MTEQELHHGPTDSELWAIEAEADLLATELALVDAESTWCRERSTESAADVLRALLDLVDLRDLCAHEPEGAVA